MWKKDYHKVEFYKIEIWKQLFENQKIKIFLNNLFLNHNIKRKQIIVTKSKQNNMFITNLI